MTLLESVYWVGSMNGQLVIYDPEIQLDASRHVILYFRMHERYVPYIKTRARAIIKKVPQEHNEYLPTINQYRLWLKTNKEQKIQSIKEDVAKRDKNYEIRISTLKEKHRKHVEGAGKIYTGAAERTNVKVVRTTVCYSCHRTISNDINLICNTCGWIICPMCGMCGCGYDGDPFVTYEY